MNGGPKSPFVSGRIPPLDGLQARSTAFKGRGVNFRYTGVFTFVHLERSSTFRYP